MQGFLTKKARFGSNWKKRFLVLRENFLFYYKSDKEKNEAASGVVRIDDSNVQIVQNSAFSDIKFPFLITIEISTLAKPLVFHLTAERPILNEWFDHLSTASAWWTSKSSVNRLKSARENESRRSFSSQ